MKVEVRPVSAGVPARLEPPVPGGTAIRQVEAWRSGVPSVTSLDARVPTAVDQALADLAALRIVDEAHPDRPVVAAGDGPVELVEVQPEGKPRMAGRAWANGARWVDGGRLGS